MSDTPYSNAALKRGTWQLLSGKALSALLTFLILFRLVQVLPVIEYGAYITLEAGIELGYGLSDFGLHWLGARYLPDYRLNASGKQLKTFCIRFLFMTAFSLLLVVAIFIFFLEYYLEWVSLDSYRMVAQIYLGLYVVEGLGRMLRDSMMGALMMQGAARQSILVRQSSFFIMIALLDFTGNDKLINVVWAELVACFLSLTVSLISMGRHLAGLRNQAGKLDWSAPRMSAIWQMAFSMYAANLLTMATSPQVFMNLIQRLLGAEAVALFGFLLNLNYQVAAYLPANLLFGLIRPKLVASYVGGGGMAELNRNANLAGKLSLFVLMPLLALAALAGDSVVALLSSGKFLGSGWLLLGIILTLVPFSQRLLLESVAVAISKAGMCTWAAASGIIVLPIFWVLIDRGLGVWAGIIVIALVHLLFNFVLVASLSRFEGFRSDWIGFLKLTFSALAAYGASVLLPLDVATDIWESPWAPLMMQGTFAVLVYLLIAWVIKPFTPGERDTINFITKRRVFVW